MLSSHRILRLLVARVREILVDIRSVPFLVSFLDKPMTGLYNQRLISCHIGIVQRQDTLQANNCEQYYIMLVLWKPMLYPTMKKSIQTGGKKQERKFVNESQFQSSYIIIVVVKTFHITRNGLLHGGKTPK